MSEPIRVVIADDHPLFRDGLAALLRAGPGTELAGAASSGPEAVELAARERPDVVIMDLRMPGLSNSSTTVYTDTAAGVLGDAGWPALDSLHVWQVPPALITPALDGHAFQVVGVMSVGKNDPIVEAKLSEIFIITQA